MELHLVLIWAMIVRVKAKKSQEELEQTLIDMSDSGSSSIPADVVGDDGFSLVYSKSPERETEELAKGML